MEVLEISQNPDIGTADIAKVVSRDPALVTKILKVSNSVWCGVRREVTTLGQAVNLLGVNGTMGLALSFSLVRGLRKTVIAHFDHQMYWRRSVISATATLAVGMATKAANHDEYFLAGLLQDIGMLVLNEALPEYGKMVASSKNDHRILIKNEQQELDTDHSQVGAWFLDKCGLPVYLVAATGGSHINKDNDDPIIHATSLGSRIAEIWISPNTTAVTAEAAESARKLLHLSSDQFSLALAKTAADLPQTTKNLDIPVGNETFINGLLDQAREAIAEINIRALQEAHHFAAQAQRDALTSLYNRAYLNQILKDQFDLSRSTAQPLTLVFIDIDRFKGINDTYGHHGGDAILISVAQVIQSAVRENDTIVRYGGDEFVVLLTNTDDGISAEIAERIRDNVEKHPHYSHEGRRIPVTVSVGWATNSSNILSANQLLETADNSLFTAKSAGRNCVSQAV
jgi:diguanylate cyclase (GGDEF)-like protein